MSSLQELQDLIQRKFDIDPATLDPNASMREKGLDSLALVEFLFEVEDHFGISMPDEDSEIDTLAQLAQAVDRIRAAKQDAAMASSAALPPAPASPPASPPTP